MYIDPEKIGNTTWKVKTIVLEFNTYLLNSGYFKNVKDHIVYAIVGFA